MASGVVGAIGKVVWDKRKGNGHAGNGYDVRLAKVELKTANLEAVVGGLDGKLDAISQQIADLRVVVAGLSLR